jgi:hypothetical protein
MACSQAAWHTLLTSSNANSEKVRVPAKALEEVLDCHAATGHMVPHALRASNNVPRLELFAFVQEHGRVCRDSAPPLMTVSPELAAADARKTDHVKMVLAVRALAKDMARKAGTPEKWQDYKEAAAERLQKGDE